MIVLDKDLVLASMSRIGQLSMVCRLPDWFVAAQVSRVEKFVAERFGQVVYDPTLIRQSLSMIEAMIPDDHTGIEDALVALNAELSRCRELVSYMETAYLLVCGVPRA